MHGGWVFSPFIVPIGVFGMVFGITAVKAIADYQVRKLQSKERLAAIEKGILLPADPVGCNTVLGGRNKGDMGLYPDSQEETMIGSPAYVARRISKVRTRGIVLLSIGMGITMFFVVLSTVLRVRAVMCGAAVGMIPLCIGIGVLADALIQKRSLAEALAATPSVVPPHGGTE
jgi:hypothetical protein